MNDINWIVAEMMVEQALHPAELPRELRLGLRLDPAAGEGLGMLDLSPAHGGRRS